MRLPGQVFKGHTVQLGPGGGRSWSLWKRTACVHTQAGMRARVCGTVPVCKCRRVCVHTRAGSPHLTPSEVRDPSTPEALICARGEAPTPTRVPVDPGGWRHEAAPISHPDRSRGRDRGEGVTSGGQVTAAGWCGLGPHLC